MRFNLHSSALILPLFWRYQENVCSRSLEFWQEVELTLLYLSTILTEKKNYQCTTCDQTFLQAEFLRRHQQCVHAKDKPFHCELCHRCFGQKINLQKHHWRKHSQGLRKNYACDKCNKAFLTSMELKNHQLYHDSHRQYQCQHCPMSFIEKAHLDRHTRRIHQNLRPFICTLGCGKTFCEKYELNYHLKSSCPLK